MVLGFQTILIRVKIYNNYYKYLFMHNKRSTRINTIILGQSKNQKIKKSRVLVVGAGGIGCQLLKNLSKTGYKNITILDFDLIEITNLNRQFYFRKDHIGKSKAEIAKDSILKLDSSLQIISINDSIINPKYNQIFYQQFDLVFSCLDSMKVRQYLAIQTTKNNIPLIDAGTMSYYGQAFATIRFKTNCHNCNPTQQKQNSGAYCSIRSKPQNPSHCAIYAKSFYDSFFGGDMSESLGDKLKMQYYLSKGIQEYSDDELKDIGKSLFRQFFDDGIRDVDLQGNKIDLVRKLSYQDALKMNVIVKNPQKSTYSSIEHLNQLNSIYQQQKLWSISQYTLKFIDSFISLIKRYFKKQTPPKFQKDDDHTMMLVFCITNLRTYNFINQYSIYNKLKYLTYYQCKDLIGRVFPAIASTNAIAAALQLRESINILNNDFHKMRYISISNRGDERLSPAHQSKHYISCDYCSQKIINAQVLLDMDKVTMRQLQQFSNYHLLTMNRDIYCGSLNIMKNSKNETKNKDKYISFLKNLNLINDGVVSLTFRSQSHEPEILINLAVIHKANKQGIQLRNTRNRLQLKQQLISYFRQLRRQENEMYHYQFSLYGGFEM